MTKETFTKLVSKLNESGQLEKVYIGWNQVISVEKKFLITLLYLASEISMNKLSNDFNVAVSTIYNVIQEVISRLCHLTKNFIRWPTQEECDQVSSSFEAIANFPGVIGAIDGTHIKGLCPSDQQDSYTNRKTNKSIILQCVCLSNKILTNVFVGLSGAAHDAWVLQNSGIYNLISSQGRQVLFYEDKYHLLGDSAYPLRDWLITPFRRLYLKTN